MLQARAGAALMAPVKRLPEMMPVLELFPSGHRKDCQSATGKKQIRWSKKTGGKFYNSAVFYLRRNHVSALQGSQPVKNWLRTTRLAYHSS